jgi:hypothetical protein
VRGWVEQLRSGSCVETDLDGDNVLTKFDADAHYIVGGTGKYKGITGKAPYSLPSISLSGRLLT